MDSVYFEYKKSKTPLFFSNLYSLSTINVL